MIKNLHCFLTDRCSEKDNFICRICLNIFYSEIKYNEQCVQMKNTLNLINYKIVC